MKSERMICDSFFRTSENRPITGHAFPDRSESEVHRTNRPMAVDHRWACSEGLISVACWGSMDDLLQLIRMHRQARTADEAGEIAGAIAERVAPSIHLLVKGRCPRHLVEDVCQEAIVAVVKSLSSFEGESVSQFRSWYLRIAWRRLADQLRKPLTQRETPSDMDELNRLLEASTQRQPARPDELAQLAELLRVLVELGDRCWQYIRMRFLEGFKYSEIAEDEGLNPDAIRMQVERCLDRARCILIADERTYAGPGR